MPLTKDQAEMLTALAIAARPHGAPRWHHAGVMEALKKVAKLDLAEVIKTVGRAAGDRTLDTPAAIGNPSAPCWIERPIERYQPEKTTPAERCGICAHARHDGQCPKCAAVDDHAFEPDFKTKRGDEVTQIVAALRDQTEPMREPATPTKDTAITPGAGRARLNQTTPEVSP